MASSTASSPLRRAVLGQVLQEALEQQQQSTELAALLTAIDVQAAREAVFGDAPAKLDTHAWLAGSTAGLLGVRGEELEAQLAGPAATEAALQLLLPRVEGRLVERCRQLAVAANYDGSSYDGLADYLQQLCVAGDRRAEAQWWGKAAGAAEQSLQALSGANELLVAILSQHKLGKQKEADEARAAYLHAQCSMLLEKLRVVEAQLLGATYTQATIPALRRAAQHLEAAVGEMAGKLREASSRLAQYQALGPRFEALAREHIAAQQQIAETQYQLQEVEQFEKLQQVIG